MFFSRFREVVVLSFFFWIVLKQRIERCEENCLSSISARPSSSNESWLENWSTIATTSSWNMNSFQLYGIATWPNNSDAFTSPPVCPWMARTYNKEFLFLELKQYWNLILLLLQEMYFIHPTILVQSNPIEQRRQFPFHLDQNDVPVSWPILKISYEKSIFFVEFVGGNINPLPFSHRNGLLHVVHWIRRNKFLRRMSFLDAGLVQLCGRRFVFFCNCSVSFSVVIPYLWDWVLLRDDVTLPRSGSVLGKWLPRMCACARSWMVSEFQFHTCQETW